MNHSVKIDIIGTFPPPIGGTSVHIQRLHCACQKKGFDSVVYDTHGKGKEYKNNTVPITNYKKFLIRYLFDCRADVIHSHTHSWKDRAFLTFKANLCRQKMIFTFHSFRDEFQNLSAIEKMCVAYVVRKAHFFIATCLEVEQKLMDWGMKKEKVFTISPFILPEKKQGEDLDKELINFIEKFDFILCATGSNNEHYHGVDLYGIDMCINLEDVLKEKYNCGFVFVLSQESDREYLKSLKKDIVKKNIEEKFLIIQHPVNFTALLLKTKIFVRPTCSDTRALSVDESIVMGCPAVASDVCWHPNSCVIFEKRNQADFNKKVMHVLENYEQIKENVLNDVVEDATIDIFRVYEKCFQQSDKIR